MKSRPQPEQQETQGIIPEVSMTSAWNSSNTQLGTSNCPRTKRINKLNQLFNQSPSRSAWPFKIKGNDKLFTNRAHRDAIILLFRILVLILLPESGGSTPIEKFCSKVLCSSKEDKSLNTNQALHMFMKVFSFTSAASTCSEMWARIGNRQQIKTPQNHILFPDGSNESRNTYSMFATGSGPKMSEMELERREVVRHRPQQNGSDMREHSNVQRRSLHIHQQIYGHEWMTFGGLGEL